MKKFATSFIFILLVGQLNASALAVDLFGKEEESRLEESDKWCGFAYIEVNSFNPICGFGCRQYEETFGMEVAFGCFLPYNVDWTIIKGSFSLLYYHKDWRSLYLGFGVGNLYHPESRAVALFFPMFAGWHYKHFIVDLGVDVDTLDRFFPRLRCCFSF